jgi:uncharacterized damage-inducible protein DinB
MKEVAFVVDQMKRAYRGEAWHGPALRELLADVTAEKAAARPLAAAHSIWEIALHTGGWIEVARLRVKGEAVENPEQGDWPAVDGASEEAWQKTIARLDEAHNRLVEEISSLPDSKLWERPAGRKETVLFTLHGVIHHNIYHAGQIALLKKP